MKFHAITIRRKSLASRESQEMFVVENIHDIPLTRRYLTKFLHKSGITIEEIAFMYEDFRENPHKKIAHFGIMGQFLFTE